MVNKSRRVDQLSDWEYWDLKLRLVQLKLRLSELNKKPENVKELADDLEFYLAGEINPWE